MKPSLRHPIGERRRVRRPRRMHRPPAARVPGAAREPAAAPQPPAVLPQPTNASPQGRLGAPSTDLACYSCQCGYVFTATPTTTVQCPHCGTPQAW